MCPQNRTEAVLLRRLESLGGSVQRPWQVTSVQPENGDVNVRMKNDDEEKVLRAKWLIGCDGAHSVVRQQAAIPFEGADYQESFILADVEMDWPLGRDEVTLFFSEQGLMVIAPLPHERYRIVAAVPPSNEELTSADFERVLEERGPDNTARVIRHVVWSSRFHIQHRLAKALRAGHILLAGDGAHVHSPAGGQGMNTGIQDAVSLASALYKTLRDGNDKALDECRRSGLRSTTPSWTSPTGRLTQTIIATRTRECLAMSASCSPSCSRSWIGWMGKTLSLEESVGQRSRMGQLGCQFVATGGVRLVSLVAALYVDPREP